jgi:DNA-binding PadR family transcriptional regulator
MMIIDEANILEIAWTFGAVRAAQENIEQLHRLSAKGLLTTEDGKIYKLTDAGRAAISK